jgi:hypothetical protein
LPGRAGRAVATDGRSSEAAAHRAPAARAEPAGVQAYAGGRGDGPRPRAPKSPTRRAHSAHRRARPRIMPHTAAEARARPRLADTSEPRTPAQHMRSAAARVRHASFPANRRRTAGAQAKAATNRHSARNARRPASGRRSAGPLSPTPSSSDRTLPHPGPSSTRRNAAPHPHAAPEPSRRRRRPRAFSGPAPRRRCHRDPHSPHGLLHPRSQPAVVRPTPQRLRPRPPY